MTNIGRLHAALGDDVWRYILDSFVGVIVKFVDRQFTWSSKPVHYLLTHRLKTSKRHEIWSLVDNQPIRFSLCKFAAFTGMKTYLYEVAGEWDVDHSEFWGEMGVSVGDGPMWIELEKVISKCRS
ncbi:unnamed protein product [Arabis nemorensis]|uniref:DUF1985 domain-containing protein n=1 Tax=Arabis nemorensis TaxID=586526 RepID=A0A565BZX3_9BRAS|nr:unnamed protein product [Arabis nemorensis]